MHRLALALGKTVGELASQLSFSEFVSWCAFYDLEPWGYHMDNWRSAIQPLVAVQIASKRGRGREFTLQDFMRKPHPAVEKARPLEDSPEAFKEMMNASFSPVEVPSDDHDSR